MKRAAESKSDKDLPQLVFDLDSDDAAIRFYAVSTLRRLTGLTFDYHYYDDETERQPAIKQWKQWLAQRQARTQPAGPTGGG
jgi:hypothetical protein